MFNCSTKKTTVGLTRLFIGDLPPANVYIDVKKTLNKNTP
jgi:hypothetical protein